MARTGRIIGQAMAGLAGPEITPLLIVALIGLIYHTQFLQEKNSVEVQCLIYPLQLLRWQKQSH